VLVCFIAVAIISKLSGPAETMDEIEARERGAPLSVALSPANLGPTD
jgi:hypothetical protein